MQKAQKLGMKTMIVTKICLILFIISMYSCTENKIKNCTENDLKKMSISKGAIYEIYLNHWTKPMEGCNFTRFHFKIYYKNTTNNSMLFKYVSPHLCALIDTNTNFKLLVEKRVYPVYIYNDSIPPAKVSFFDIKAGDSIFLDLILMNPVFYESHSLMDIISESEEFINKKLKILVLNDSKVDTLISNKNKKINFYLNGELVNENDTIKMNERLVLPEIKK